MHQPTASARTSPLYPLLILAAGVSLPAAIAQADAHSMEMDLDLSSHARGLVSLQPNEFDPGSTGTPPTIGGERSATERPIRWSADLTGSRTFSAGFDDASGDVSITRLGADLSAAVPITDRSSLTLRIGTEASVYSFDPSSQLLPTLPAVSDPIGTAVTTILSVGVFTVENSTFSWTASGRIGFSGETDADLDEAFIYGASGGAFWRINDTLQLGVFGSVRNALDDEGILWILVPAVNWSITDRWRLETATNGLITLSYAATDSLSLSLDTGFEQHQYRLSDDGPIPDGTFTDRRIPVAAGLRVNISPRAWIQVRGGAYVWSNIEVLDGNDNELADEDGDVAAFLGLFVSIAF